PNAGLRCARRFTRAFPISYRASPAADGSGAAGTPAADARRGRRLPHLSPAFGLAVRQLPEPGFAEPPDTAGAVPAASAPRPGAPVPPSGPPRPPSSGRRGPGDPGPSTHGQAEQPRSAAAGASVNYGSQERTLPPRSAAADHMLTYPGR